MELLYDKAKSYALAKNNPPSKIFLNELFIAGKRIGEWWHYNGWAYNVNSKQLYTVWPNHMAKNNE